MSSADLTPDRELQDLLREKLDFLRKQEIITADAEQKFSLKKSIEALEGQLSALTTAPASRHGPVASEALDARPTYRDEETKRLSCELQDLYDRREQLTIANEDARAVDSKILDVRRLLRKGPQLQSGEFLLDGRYLLVELLGQGGFGTVWKAYDRTLHRLVAAKVLHGHHSEERSCKERFFRGSSKMAELGHPHIVRVLEKEAADDGWLFFVMELVAGGDFGRAVLERKLSTEQKLTIVCKVGQALEFAHSRGVTHRDVKPSNILLDYDLEPKLTDFDLVREEDSTGFTQTRAMLGTLPYAAPEVLEAPKSAGPPADVYSLASTAVFALQGEPLPRGYYRNPAKTISRLPVFQKLADVLNRATESVPERRYASAGEFVKALDSALASITKEPSRKILVVIAGPSACGKTTISHLIRSRLRELGIDASFVLKYTTRAARPGEGISVDGSSYDPSIELKFMISPDELARHSDIVSGYYKYGHYYGLSREHLGSEQEEDRILICIYGELERLSDFRDMVLNDFERDVMIVLLSCPEHDLSHRLALRHMPFEAFRKRTSEIRRDAKILENRSFIGKDFFLFRNANKDDPNLIADSVVREVLGRVGLLEALGGEGV